MTPTAATEVPLYGLDIETDTTLNGLDPTLSRVTAVGIAGRGWSRAFVGGERRILQEVDGFLGQLPPGNIVTWNGSVFDFPFLWDRAMALGMPIDLFMSPEPGLTLPHGPPTGHAYAYRIRWGEHAHIDAYLSLRDTAHAMGGSASLKPFAESHGIVCVVEDAARTHELTPSRLASYVASDATAALELADWYALRHQQRSSIAPPVSTRGVVAIEEPARGSGG